MIDSPIDSEEACAACLRELIQQDPYRLQLLVVAEAFAAQHQLPDALLAAGFVRNCVWDYLHQLPTTPLNDVDLIYFDAESSQAERDKEFERLLASEVEGVSWEVKNQARMSVRNDDPVYADSIDAMRFWPEQQTAVGIRLDGSRAIVSSFGLRALFAAKVQAGPNRTASLMFERARQKRWLRRWPKLQLLEC